MIGTHLATLNLFREPDGTLEITVAEGAGALQEIDRVRFPGKPIDYIEAAERLNMTGEIGDGMVARLHELASLARLEQNPADVLQAHAERSGRTVPGHERLRALADERVRLEPMRHRCGTCQTVDGHMPGCAENEPCGHAWHAFPCPNSWGSICPGCGEAG